MNKIKRKEIILYIFNINNPVNNSAVYILLYFHILFVVGGGYVGQAAKS